MKPFVCSFIPAFSKEDDSNAILTNQEFKWVIHDTSGAALFLGKNLFK